MNTTPPIRPFFRWTLLALAPALCFTLVPVMLPPGLASPLGPVIGAVPGAAQSSAGFAPGSRYLTRERAARIDSIFSDLNSVHSPGCALGVEEGGRLVLGRGYGMADLDQGVPIRANTVFRIGSTSKQFAAAAIVLLELDGALSVDDEYRTHIAELPDFGESLTLRHVLNHTSGLRDWLGLMSLRGEGSTLYERQDVLDLMADQDELNFPVGSRYLYSNSGFLMLADVVERTTGKSMRQFTNERIFEPLEMTSTLFHDEPNQIIEGRAVGYTPHPEEGFRISMSPLDVVGAGGLLTTVEDFARWSRNLATGEVGGPQFVDRLLRRGVLANGDTIDYALGISHGEFRGLRTLGHGGSWAGYRADFLRFPDQGTSIAVFCNVTNGDPGGRARQVAGVLLEDVMDPLPPEEDQPTADEEADAAEDEAEIQEEVPPLTPDELTAFAGDYRSPELGVVYRFRVEEGELRLADPSSHAGTLAHIEDDSFRIRNYTLRFLRESDGTVAELRIDAGRVLNLRFVRLQ